MTRNTMTKPYQSGPCACGRHATVRKSNQLVCDRCIALDAARHSHASRRRPVRPENQKYAEACGSVPAAVGRGFGL